MASRFADVKTLAPVPIFALTAKFNEDPHPKKVNLGVGAYRTDESKPWVLPVVRTVESQMAADMTLNHEYLPIIGMPAFRTAAIKLLLGEDSPALLENRAEGIQSVGGSGALRTGADFLKKVMGMDCVYISNPTWGNHHGIFGAAGFSIREYRYWDAEHRSLDIEGMLEDLRTAPPNAVVVIHACAHNPTGVDPSDEEMKRIVDVCEQQQLFVFLDIAYQGFATGNIQNDARMVRYFVDRGFEIFAAQSFSKNFGLYNERVGNLCVVTRDEDSKNRLRSQMEIIIRHNYSNGPNHGVRIVATTLNNPALYSQWKENVKTMADRILLMRQQLFQKLKALGVPGSWNHITEQIGMFSYTGMSEAQVAHLIKTYHIYLPPSGRINMCALTTQNIDYVAEAILDVVTNVTSNDAKL